MGCTRRRGLLGIGVLILTDRSSTWDSSSVAGVQVVTTYDTWSVCSSWSNRSMRAAAGGRKERGTDPLKLLRNQGFDAIKGVGGFVSF